MEGTGWSGDLGALREPDTPIGSAAQEQVVRLLLRCQLLPVEGLADYEAAAELYRRCRAGGDTVGNLTHCLIAAVAVRHGAAVLHRDHDFEVIARHSPLRVA